MYQMKLGWIGMSQYVLSLSKYVFQKGLDFRKTCKQASVS